MITAIVRAGAALSKGSKLIPKSVSPKPVLASKSVKLAPTPPQVTPLKKGTGLVKSPGGALDFATSFASAFSDTSGIGGTKQRIKSKDCCETLTPLVDSISKKLIQIDKLLKDELKFNRNDSAYRRKKQEKKKYKQEEEKLETPKKVKPKKKLSPDAPGISFGERIKRFIMFTLLGWLVDKIIPLLPKLAPIFEGVGRVIHFGTELFGGLVSGLSKFLEFGIKLTNGLTKSLGFITGARSEKEFEDFEKKFNRMVDLSILAAMLVADSGNDLFDMFGKGKGKGGRPSRPSPGKGGRPKVTTSGGKGTGRFSKIKERFTSPFRQKSKVTTSGGRETGILGKVKDIRDKITRPTAKVTTSGGRGTGILDKISDLGTKLKKTISPTKITGSAAKPGLLKGATENTQKLLGAAKQSKVLTGTKNVLSKVKLPPAVGKVAGPIGTVLFAGLEYGGRKASGQSTTQAAIGTGASVAGGLAGAAGGAQAGALIGAAIGAPFAGVGAVPGAAIGGVIGGILGGLGGSWAASTIADKATGADKATPKVEKKADGGVIGNTFNVGDFIKSNQNITESALPKWFEKANKKRESTSSVKISIPKKKKPQSEKPGKDIGGYGEITKIFPDPEGKVSGTGSSQGGTAVTSAAQKKAGFNILNPFSWFNKATSGSTDSQPQQPQQSGTKQPNSLLALTKASQSLKKIPFVGHIMGASVDIAMGQKPDRDLYQTMADSVLYLGQKAAEGQVKDIQTNIQKLADGGISSLVNSSVSLDSTKVATKTLRDTLAGAIEMGANAAIKNVKDEIVGGDVRGTSIAQASLPPVERDPSARGGYDPRYDQPSGSDQETPSGGGGGGGGGIYKPILDLIAKYEAGAGKWESMYPSTKLPGATKMTIAEVARRATGAVGMYQNMPEYLVARAKAVGLDPNKDLYNEENQRKIAVYLIEKGQAGVTPKMLKDNPDEAMIRMARVWAAIPVPKDMQGASRRIRRGDSYYAGVGSNKAHITPEMMYQAMGASVKLNENPKKQEEYKGSDPRSKDDDKKGGPKIGGGNVVSIGKSLISQGFAVAEHPDFTKSVPKGSYTPGKGVVHNVHKGRGHYEGRAIDVTDWRGSLADSQKRYRSVLDSLQNNPNINMLIHDTWGFKDRTGKDGPGSYGHPTHMHIETRFHGGLVDKDSLVKIHKNEFVVDKDTVNLFGVDFFKTINAVENKVTLKKISNDLVDRINQVSHGKVYTIQETDSDPKGEERKPDSETTKASQEETTKNLDEFNKQEESKTEIPAKEDEEKGIDKKDKKQKVQVIAASHPQTGSGFTIKGVNDGSGRPLILSKGAIQAFGKMMKDSKGVVKGSDVASGKRSKAHNKKVGGVPNSNHLGGNALDIHGSSNPWMRKHGKAYGWIVNDYPGTHGGHFDYKGEVGDDEGETYASTSSDIVTSSVTDFGSSGGGAASGGGSYGGGSSGGGGGASSPGGSSDEDGSVNVDVEPTEEKVPGSGGSVPKGFRPGSVGSFTTDKGQIDHKAIQRFIMNNEGSIKDSQGRHTRYKDSRGFWTIGYGHLWKEGDPTIMSNEEAEKLFEKDYKSHRKAAENIPGFAKASAAQQAALIDLTFNMGPAWYKEWPSFSAAMKKGDYEKAQSELKNSAWYKQVGGRAPKIIDMIGRVGVPGGPPSKPGADDKNTPGGKDEPGSTGSISMGDYSIDTKNEFLKSAGTGRLKHGTAGDGLCTSNVLLGLDKLGHTFAPEGTTADSSNPRGLVSQLIGKSDFTSIPGLGNEQLIKSPYGNVKARVVPFKDYQAAVEKGLIPSGAFVFSTRHKSWNAQTGSSSGFDTAISRDGGRIAWNGTGSSGNAIYGDATQSIIVLVPKSSIKKNESSPTATKPGAKPGGAPSLAERLGFGSKTGSGAKPGQPGAKPGGKPKQNWLQSAASNLTGLLTGKKKLGILKAEGGGQIDSSGIITRPKAANVGSFAPYEDPSGPAPQIIIVPGQSKQQPQQPGKKGASPRAGGSPGSRNKYYSPARRK